MRWIARDHQFEFPRPMIVMGIVNTTPDSFSDGGHFLDPDAAVTHALRLANEGAEILDIGGESSRPGSAAVSEQEELDRVIPVIERLAMQPELVLSIDTQKPNVAREAIATGASIVNDVAANREDPEMWQIVAEANAGYICMHMQGTPQTMQTKPVYDDVTDSIRAFFDERLKRLAVVGLRPEQDALDPGIGFGKTLEHNIKLLRYLNKFNLVERPLLFGASRKSFIEKLLGVPVDDRLPASLACATWAAIQGSQIIRVHDVAETVQAVRMTEALTR